jgi:hypothetical protein
MPIVERVPVVMFRNAAPVAVSPFGHHENRMPTHGYAATREA